MNPENKGNSNFNFTSSFIEKESLHSHDIQSHLDIYVHFYSDEGGVMEYTGVTVINLARQILHKMAFWEGAAEWVVLLFVM